MENIILRKAKADDLDAMWENVWQDKELAEYMLWKPVENYDEAKIRLEKTIEFQRTNYAFYVCLEDTDEAIGLSGQKRLEKVFLKIAGSVFRENIRVRDMENRLWGCFWKCSGKI